MDNLLFDTMNSGGESHFKPFDYSNFWSVTKTNVTAFLNANPVAISGSMELAGNSNGMDVQTMTQGVQGQYTVRTVQPIQMYWGRSDYTTPDLQMAAMLWSTTPNANVLNAVGLCSSTPAGGVAPTGIFFYNSGSGTWKARINSTDYDTGVGVTSGYHSFEIVVTNNLARFYIDGVLVREVNIGAHPTPTNLYPTVHCTQLAGLASVVRHGIGDIKVRWSRDGKNR